LRIRFWPYGNSIRVEILNPREGERERERARRREGGREGGRERIRGNRRKGRQETITAKPTTAISQTLFMKATS